MVETFIGSGDGESVGNLSVNDRTAIIGRPQGFADFVGQSEVIANLKVFIDAARHRQRAMDHLILYGPPGLGKTTLAQIVARELGVEFHQTSGPVLAKPGDLAAMLSNLPERAVLFIDEIHRMPVLIEEQLYSAMEDFALDLLVGSGPGARSVRIDINPFTLVGATTRLGLLSAPLRSRFGIMSRLQHYPPEDLARVVHRAALLSNQTITCDAALEVGRRSRGTPRIAGRMLRRIADFATAQGRTVIDVDTARYALHRLGIDEDGLSETDQRYIDLLADAYAGGPVGVETIAAALSDTRDSIEGTVEPYLLQEGFIQRTPRGRTLTARGWSKARLGFPEKGAAA